MDYYLSPSAAATHPLASPTFPSSSQQCLLSPTCMQANRPKHFFKCPLVAALGASSGANTTPSSQHSWFKLCSSQKHSGPACANPARHVQRTSTRETTAAPSLALPFVLEHSLRKYGRAHPNPMMWPHNHSHPLQCPHNEPHMRSVKQAVPCPKSYCMSTHQLSWRA